MTKQEFIDYIKSLTQTSFMRSKKNSAYPQQQPQLQLQAPQQQQNPLKRRPNLTLSSRASAHRNSTLSRLSAQNSASA